MPKEEANISESLNKLEDIVSWFDEQEDVDVEEGLKKVKAGASLIKDLKGRLKEVENEFEEVKKDLAEEE
ncbi:MAG: exodeoxyribonuclease VII small subunit [Parcubacteria group bacterium]|nr:exodeoxyribonuclease VII small subunit [Parcubacteria group bacterium]